MATREDIEADAQADRIYESRLAAGDFDGPGAEWHHHEVPNGRKYASVGITYTNDGETEVLIHVTPREAYDLAQAILALLKRKQP